MMKQYRKVVIVNEIDNVATLMDDSQMKVSISNDIAIPKGLALGHKVALSSIKKGESVIKYGIPIGVATQNISPGDHVHVHNCN